MIPIRLALSNFMCYRDNVPPLYLNGVRTASICGSNGHGKSALIDAMTWALWGQTRAKRDDDLIHTGEAETAVEFDFAVGEQEYRILRKHRRPKRRGASGQTILEFQIAANGDFKAITGNTISQTQQKIIDTLHMDYATFINSAYLRQGHADEFTTAHPARRKQVLANILGLSYYDNLEAKAKEMAKEQEARKEQLESAIANINEELARKPTYEEELEQAQDELSQITATVKEHEAHLNQLRQQKEALEAMNWQLTQLEEHITQQTGALEQWLEQLKQQQSRLREHEDLIARRDRIEAGYKQLVEVRNSNNELEQKFRRSVNLERQKSQLELRIKEAAQSLLAEHAVAQRAVAELEARVDRLPQLRTDLQQTQHQLQHLNEEEEVLRQKNTADQQLRTRLHGLETSQSQLERDIKEIAEKLNLLLTEHGAKCPLCETELGAEGLKLIETKYTAEKQQKAESLESTRTGVASGQDELRSLEGEIARLEDRLKKDRATVQGRVGLLTQEIDDAEQAGERLEEERNRLGEIEQGLARRDFAVPQQELLTEIEKELASLDYDAQQHEQVRRQLASLEEYDEPKRRLEEADRLIEEEREAVARATDAIQQLRTSLETDGQKKEELLKELASLPKVSDDLSRAESKHRNLAAEQERAQEVIGSIKGKLERCVELEKRKKEREKLITQATKEEQIYRDLAEAFGKKGIQALLIETALPEIESEANRLLGRMTDNRMNVKIETQRETKKGDTIETLDINIADELGTRNYEMFSGGEAFRINFSIRVALSKLLARRAGAPLPTLIIDEGFGTQDTIGIEKLRETINSIQDDFEKILVITHIEELRDAFPSRIDVVKTPDGSTIEMG